MDESAALLLAKMRGGGAADKEHMFPVSVMIGAAVMVVFILLTTRPDETLTREDVLVNED